MKKYLRLFLYYSFLYRIFQFLNKNKIIILAYHGFTDAKYSNKFENYHGKNINIELFKSQIQYLKNNYNIISLKQYIEFSKKNEKLPDKSIIITIDDGYKSNYTLAFPILKEFNVPATIFLTTDFIDNKNFFWVDRLEYVIKNTKENTLNIKIDKEKLYFTLQSDYDKIFCDKVIRNKIKSMRDAIPIEIIEDIENQLNTSLPKASEVPEIYKPLDWYEIIDMLKTSKVDIGSHTHNHLLLANYDKDTIRNELILSKKIINRKTCRDANLFCYPSGSFNDKTTLLAKESGYACALTTTRGMNSNTSDLYKLKRFGIGNTDLISFITTISGVYIPFRRKIA